jgi:hypothetical protein
LLALTEAGMARVAGRPGTVADVQLTSLMADGATVLLGFHAAGIIRPGGRVRQSLLISLDGDGDLALLRHWEASGVPVVLWRDKDGRLAELSLVRTGQQVGFSVVPRQSAMENAPR